MASRVAGIVAVLVGALAVLPGAAGAAPAGSGESAATAGPSPSVSPITEGRRAPAAAHTTPSMRRALAVVPASASTVSGPAGPRTAN